jgi:membrane associated rhomboid family serine protease
MVRREIEKTAGLLIALIILTTTLLGSADFAVVGVCRGCQLLPRLLYSFVHANIFHCLINIWCFISIIFLYDVSWRRLLVAYLVAVAVPNFVLSAMPTVGLSTVCFVLLGSIVYQVKSKLYYNICMAVYIVAGLLMPQVNGWIHLYGYVAGLLVGFLTMPLPCKKK